MGEKKFDYSIFYAIANFTVFLVIYIFCIIFVILKVDSLILKIILSIACFFACSFFELRILMRLINPLVDLFLPESYKKEQELNAQEYREFCEEMYKKRKKLK